jgi:YVTN family beta-propeller protein
MNGFIRGAARRLGIERSTHTSGNDTRGWPRMMIIGLMVASAGVSAVGLSASVSSPAAASTSGTAYVVNYESNTVTPIDLATDTAGTPIPVGSQPDAIAIAPDGDTAYVANGGSNTLTPIDLATNTAGTPIPAGSGPGAIAITPNGDTAYVVNGSNTVTPINLTTDTASTPITVASGPIAIAINPSGTTAYVVSGNDPNPGIVTPITVATNTAGTPISVGDDPRYGHAILVGGPNGSIAINPSGTTAYVTGWVEIDDMGDSVGAVVPIHLATNTLGTAFDDLDTSVATGIAIAPSGSTAYFSDTFDNAEVPVDLTTNTPGTPITVGGAPEDAAITSDGSMAYVANSASNTVTPIIVATNTAGTPITVGSDPLAIAITATNSSTPGVAISPAKGTPGKAVTVSGVNFLSGEKVKVTYKTGLTAPHPKSVALCTGTAAGDGSFTCSGNIPSAASAGAPGNHTIVAKGKTSLLQATTTFKLK